MRLACGSRQRQFLGGRSLFAFQDWACTTDDGWWLIAGFGGLSNGGIAVVYVLRNRGHLVFFIFALPWQLLVVQGVFCAWGPVDVGLSSHSVRTQVNEVGLCEVGIKGSMTRSGLACGTDGP